MSQASLFDTPPPPPPSKWDAFQRRTECVYRYLDLMQDATGLQKRDWARHALISWSLVRDPDPLPITDEDWQEYRIKRDLIFILDSDVVDAFLGPSE
jgi:hypothetical protein